MEEEKLLSVLILTLLFSNPSFGSECPHKSDQDFADELNVNFQEIINSGTENISDADSSQTELRVFISSSMPIESIRQYFIDSGKYNAVLVLNGIPGGSFKKLQEFIQSISNDISNNEELKGNLVIDDGAFSKFGIQVVPTIVLSDADGRIYDKIVGNISLRDALTQFSKGSQELGSIANNILDSSK